MCLRAHWIDNDWKLNKRIINFCPISSHKGDDLGKVVEKCLLDWEIENVFTITVDNASSNDTMIIYLKKRFNNWGGIMLGEKYLHMRCIAHIVNLIVSDGLKCLGDSVARVRSAVRYVRQSPSRLAKFKTCIELEKIEFGSSLCLDVCTRWNSTYLMLNVALKYEKAFERYGEEDPLFRFELSNGNGAHGMPLEDDWVNVRRLCILLEKFYKLTLLVSGSLYVTSNFFLQEIGNIACDLQKWRLSDDASYARIANKMTDKYEKYWGSWEKTNMLIYIAALVDPRNKEDFVTFILELTYGEKESVDKLKFIKDVAFALFNDYKIKYGTEINTSEQSIGASSNNIDSGDVNQITDVRSQFKSLKAAKGSVEAKSELEKFLSEDVEADQSNFDILAYWKVNSARFPILSRMVAEYLIHLGAH
ncbi:zinc finger BED domain-containing protein RICESLEEPER 2-like [Asparagus officinalis]|uniref:zinc finger BED domain-containing protein RICESLEEPER 2-like n=1 Tax=Asparagus officinalis TaxID=4686 RepID=UPI00098DF854|nr:zinc finger BED domain-containing protein RICESLEEPER 2-like [Asparagus officinalis]